MPRWVVGVAVLAVALFAASFALARSGRTRAEPAAAAATAAPGPLTAVSLRAGVGDLRRLTAAKLPALERAPKPRETSASPAPAPATPVEPVAPTVPDTSPAPAPAPAPAPDPGGGGCDPCG